MYGCMLSWMGSSWIKFYYQRVRCSGQGVGLTIVSAWRFCWGIGSGRPSNFFLRKKSKKKKESRVTSLPSLFPPKSSRILASWSPASHSKRNEEKGSFLRTRTKQWPQHAINPANFMRQLAIAQWLVRPTVNLLNVTHHSICSFRYFLKCIF